MTNLKPGVYRDMPADDYYPLVLPSASTITASSGSPRRLERLLLDGGGMTGQSQAMKIGTAFHALNLETDDFALHYSVTPKEGKIYLDNDEMETVTGMSNAVDAHPWIKGLTGFRDTELTVIGEYHGVKVKSRIDAYYESTGTIVDLKSCSDSSRKTWTKKIQTYYITQAAVYREQLRSQGCKFSRFVFVAVERTKPHSIGVYEVGDKEMDEAWARVDRLLRDLRDARDNGFTYQEQPELITWLPRTKSNSPSPEAIEVIDMLNKMAETKYRNVRRAELEARISEHGVSTVKAVVKHKVYEWLGTDMEKYIRPETLFRASKFESYINGVNVDEVLTPQQKKDGWVVANGQAVEPFKPLEEYEDKQQGARELAAWYFKYKDVATLVGYPNRFVQP